MHMKITNYNNSILSINIYFSFCVILIFIITISLPFISCKSKSDSGNTNPKSADNYTFDTTHNINYVKDTNYIEGKYFQEALANFKENLFEFALIDFEDVRSSDKYYNEAQKYIKITKDSLRIREKEYEMTEKDTKKLIIIIENYCVKHSIDYSLLFDSLVSKGIITEDDLIEYINNRKDI
jgi:hypothetical protein